MMLADSHRNNVNLSQQAKSGDYTSVYFWAASSGTNIKLDRVMRPSAWGSEVSVPLGVPRSQARLSFPFHFQVHLASS